MMFSPGLSPGWGGHSQQWGSRSWGSPAALATEHAQIGSAGHDNGSLEDAGEEEQEGVWVGLT